MNYELVRTARIMAGIKTQTEMAKLLGVTQPGISAAEKGRNDVMLLQMIEFLLQPKYQNKHKFTQRDFIPMESEEPSLRDLRDEIKMMREDLDELLKEIKAKD